MIIITYIIFREEEEYGSEDTPPEVLFLKQMITNEPIHLEV